MSPATELCVVTGATSGIGRATVSALAGSDRQVIAVGRRQDVLDEISTAFPALVRVVNADITQKAGIDRIVEAMGEDRSLAGLVHCAGIHRAGKVVDSPVEDLDAMYLANVRGPIQLTQRLAPALVRAKGYIVFINSSAGVNARPGVGGFSATQHALRAFTSVLRDELNEDGVRVLSIYPGRTATPRMEAIFSRENRDYAPELLLQSEDVASVIVSALNLPSNAEWTDIHLRPASKSY